MEGNECYRFSTIRDHVGQTGAREVRTIIDVGTYTGAMSLLARCYFPRAKVYGLEADEKWFRISAQNTAHDPAVRIWNRAFTAQHLYRDDLGAMPYSRPVRLQLWRPGMPEGASLVLVPGEPSASATAYTTGYRPAAAMLRPITLGSLLRLLRRVDLVDEIDIMKIDCEGCEHSSLGSAAEEDLRKIRYIVGEYHYLARFYRVLEAKLFRTHKVHLAGDWFLGCFFAERREGIRDGILLHDNSNTHGFRPGMADFPIEWHEFDERYSSP